MLTANPTRFHRWFLPLYFERMARRRFARLMARGLEALAPWDGGGAAREPLLIVANHSCWWDAVLPILIARRYARQDAYGIMDHVQLARHPFFRRVGLFSVDRSNPRDAARTLDYAADLLRGTSRTLWIFPQGVIAPNDARPIRCEPGVAHLARKLGRCAILPVAFRYEMSRDEFPVAYISAGDVLHLNGATLSPRQHTAAIASLLEHETDRLRTAVLTESLTDFHCILRGRNSISEIFDF